jgi:ribonuclease HII
MTVPRLRPSLKGHAPGLEAERRWWEAGARWVVGIDEVGRGAWAGPISVGAAVLPRERRVYKVRDSKQLSEVEREALFDRVADWCERWAVGHATPQECDELGMSAAQKLATRRALEGLGISVDAVLLDGNWDFAGRSNTELIVGGDRRSLSIAAASILAKVTRDRLLRAASDHHPAYNFEANKGYPCPIHKAALQGWGPSTIHRRSWAFMDGLVWNGLERYRRPDDQLTFDLGDQTAGSSLRTTISLW